MIARVANVTPALLAMLRSRNDDGTLELRVSFAALDDSDGWAAHVTRHARLRAPHARVVSSRWHHRRVEVPVARPATAGDSDRYRRWRCGDVRRVPEVRYSPRANTMSYSSDPSHRSSSIGRGLPNASLYTDHSARAERELHTSTSHAPVTPGTGRASGCQHSHDSAPPNT